MIISCSFVMTSTDLLVIVFDTNPLWWGTSSPLHFPDCIDAIMVFCNSHLLMSHKNQLAVIAAHVNRSIYLYPKPQLPGESKSSSDDTEFHGTQDGKYEVFGKMNSTMREEIKNLILSDVAVHFHNDSVISGAMAMALCYIHRKEKEMKIGEKLESRIIVIKGSNDNPSQYMNFMNVVFTAQKQNILIDACIIGQESSLLQQACDITGGIYLKIPDTSALVQYLNWVFLPSPDVRKKLNLPPNNTVDYRAACFCHRTLIDVGYVCSVCLSIFCQFTPVCSTCQTKFNLAGLAKLPRKKGKKSS